MSNPGAGEFQDLQVTAQDGSSGPLFEAVARSVMTNWNGRDNCGLVVGATYPAELRPIRSLAPELPLLIPGVGAQGGDVEEVRVAIATPGGPCLVNSSRGIIFASNGPDFAEAAGRAANTLAESLHSADIDRGRVGRCPPPTHGTRSIPRTSDLPIRAAKVRSSLQRRLGNATEGDPPGNIWLEFFRRTR